MFPNIRSATIGVVLKTGRPLTNMRGVPATCAPRGPAQTLDPTLKPLLAVPADDAEIPLPALIGATPDPRTPDDRTPPT